MWIFTKEPDGNVRVARCAIDQGQRESERELSTRHIATLRRVRWLHSEEVLDKLFAKEITATAILHMTRSRYRGDKFTRVLIV